MKDLTMIRVCQRCSVKINESAHFNTKWCFSCRNFLLKYPKHNLTLKQQALARQLLGTMFYEKVAIKIGCSRSSLSRFAREHGLSLDFNSYKPDEIKKVCAYYEKHGKIKTQKKFPHVKVRSIVERYKLFKPRKIKWKEDQKIELARMAGLISFSDQAKFFNRPNANAGSIKSYWHKNFDHGNGMINGLWQNQAKFLFKPAHLSPIKTGHWLTKKMSGRLCLWVDLECKLNDSHAEFLRDSIRVLAQFQRWLYGAKDNQDCRQKILKIIEERST